MEWLEKLVEVLGPELLARAVNGGLDSLGADLPAAKRERVAGILGPVLPTDVSVARIRQELADELAKDDTDPPPPATPRPE